VGLLYYYGIFNVAGSMIFQILAFIAPALESVPILVKNLFTSLAFQPVTDFFY
jgi:hypothetical protein